MAPSARRRELPRPASARQARKRPCLEPPRPNCHRRAAGPAAQRRHQRSELPPVLLGLPLRETLARPAERDAQDGARRRARERPGDRRGRRAERLARARAVPHARTKPPVVDERTAALKRRSPELSFEQARVGVLPRAGHRDPVAGDLRQGQRLLPLRPRKRQPAPAPRRSHPAREQTRRRHRLGVPVPVRRRHSLRGPAASRRARRFRSSRGRGRASRNRPTSPPRSRPWASSRRRRRRACGCAAPPARCTPSTPTLRATSILNGFIQALVGLYDYTSITKDLLGLQLFEAGDAQARAEVPHYDTGAWSLYDQYGESSLNYHELLTEFLQHLCERTRRGLPFTPPPAPPASGPPPQAPLAPDPRPAALRHGGQPGGHRWRRRGRACVAAQAGDGDSGRSALLHDGAALRRRPAHAAQRSRCSRASFPRAPGPACRCPCRRSRRSR